jgi:membrane protein implicated in regulation of membrane protease activity
MRKSMKYCIGAAVLVLAFLVLSGRLLAVFRRLEIGIPPALIMLVPLVLIVLAVLVLRRFSTRKQKDSKEDVIMKAAKGTSKRGEYTIIGDFELKGTVLVHYLGSSYDENHEYRTKAIAIPQGVTEIAKGAFPKECGVRSVIIPEGVSVIESEAFYDLDTLQSVKIPGSVTVIGENAFVGTRLGCGWPPGSVKIPAGVAVIGHNAFFIHTLKAFKVDSRNQHFSSAGGVLFDKAGKTLISFPPAKGALFYRVPARVTAIGDSAFMRHSINQPSDSTDSTGSGSIFSVSIPAGVTSIGKDAFCGTFISSIKLPAGITAIEEGTFASTPLRWIKIPAGVTSIGEYAFCQTRLKSVEIPAGVTTIGGHAFVHTRLTSVSIPDSVTSIGEGAFEFTSLKSVHIAEGVKIIGKDAFFSCGELTSVSIPDSVTGIGKNAFARCRKLQAVELSRRTKVDKEAFSDSPRVDLRYRKAGGAPN